MKNKGHKMMPPIQKKSSIAESEKFLSNVLKPNFILKTHHLSKYFIFIAI